MIARSSIRFMIKALICSKRYSKLKEKLDFLCAVLNLTAQ